MVDGEIYTFSDCMLIVEEGSSVCLFKLVHGTDRTPRTKLFKKWKDFTLKIIRNGFGDKLHLT